jgi:flagellar motor switch protein FliM
MATRQQRTDQSLAKVARDFDFRFAKRLEKYSVNHLNTLRSIHDNFARLLNNSLSMYMRSSVEAMSVRLEQVTYSDFIASASGDHLYVIYSMDPLPGSGMVRIDLSLIFSIVDRLLGGPGWIPEKMRELTDIERALITKFLGRIFASYREAWNYVTSFAFRIEAMDSNPQLIPRIIPLDQMVAVSSCELRLGDASGGMTFCLPYAVLSKVAASLNDYQSSFNVNLNRETSQEDLDLLEQHVGHAEVEFEVELGSAGVSLRELVALRLGDVLLLDNDVKDPIQAFVNGCPKFNVYPGQNKEMLAVQIFGNIEL